MKPFSHVLFALVLIVIMSACSSKTNAMNVEQINVDDVISLQVGNVLGLELPKSSKLFQQTDANGHSVIIKVVGWLNSSKLSKAAAGEMQFAKHGYPMVMNIKMNDRKVVHIKPAYTCTFVKNKDGSGLKTCSDIKGEILLTKDSETTIRLTSPEVYDWLQAGWKQE